ncbi:MAG TPA: tetratricopeptide repeat protein, partial [Elusimicrobiota bacterium]|nr:tetratricopeptide repeat protein [Elusimicrobiota bacterium]
QWGQGLYREGSYAAAAEAFEKVSSRASAPELRSASLYNAGNAYFRQGKTDEAIKKYKEALRLFPSDPDAKHNLEFARKLKKAGGKPRPQPGSPKDDKKPRDGSGSSGEPPINESKGAGTMTKEDAERLLQAVEDQEKRAQRRARRGQPPEPPQGPDW